MHLSDVTVLIPTYNRQPLLAQALASAVAQEGVRLEVVVVDDGSSDATADYLAATAAAHPDVVRVVRQENAGQPRAVNRGLDEARAELVSILSDDDVLLPGALEALVGALRSDPAAVVAGGRFEVVEADDTHVAVYTPAGLDLAGALAHCECQFGPGTVFRRSVVDAVGGWDPSFRGMPDFDFWLRCGLAGGYAFTTHQVARYRRHDGSVTAAELGPAYAREFVELMTAFYARDDLPPEVLAVKEQAFRTAYFRGAVVCGPGLNGPGERYTAEDLLDPVSLGREPARDGLPLMANVHERAAELHHEVVRLHGEVATRDELVRGLQAEVVARDQAIRLLEAAPRPSERPSRRWWARASRQPTS